MAKAAAQTQLMSMEDEVRNKTSRRKKSTYVRPLPSLLRPTANFQLLSNGGRLHHVEIPYIGGKAEVRMHSTCTLDNALMMFGISYMTNDAFKSNLNRPEFANGNVAQFCKSFELATSQADVQLARFNTVKNCQVLWSKKNIVQETKRRVYCSLDSNESDIVNLVFGKHQKHVIRGYCHNSNCPKKSMLLTRTKLDVRIIRHNNV
jgi:hypothetical protein